jgi:hypothetical protein
MNGARATKNISLVLVSSLLVFAGWNCGDRLREETEQPGHPGGQRVHASGGGSRFFWWHSTYYYTGGGGTGIGGGAGGAGGGKSGAPTTSARGGFGTTGHAAGA